MKPAEASPPMGQIPGISMTSTPPAQTDVAKAKSDRDFLRQRAPELLSLDFSAVKEGDPNATLDIKNISASAVRAVELLSPADKTRVFTAAVGLRADRILPAEFFQERHRMTGNMPRNFTNRLSQLMEEAQAAYPSLKRLLSNYDSRLPSLLMELENGGYYAVSIFLALYGFPDPTNLEAGGSINRVHAADVGKVMPSSQVMQQQAQPIQRFSSEAGPCANIMTPSALLHMPTLQPSQPTSMFQGSQPSAHVEHGGPILTAFGISADERLQIQVRAGVSIPDSMMDMVSACSPDGRTGEQIVITLMNLYAGKVSRSSARDFYEMLVTSCCGGKKPTNYDALESSFNKCMDTVRNLASTETSMASGMQQAQSQSQWGAGFESYFGFGQQADPVPSAAVNVFDKAFGVSTVHHSGGGSHSMPHGSMPGQGETQHHGMQGAKRPLEGMYSYSDRDKSARLGIGHPELTSVPMSSAEAASATPIGSGTFGAVASPEASAFLQRSMALFASQRAPSRQEAEQAYEAMSLTNTITTEFRAPKTFGQSALQGEIDAHPVTSDVSAAEGLVHYANLGHLLKSR